MSANVIGFNAVEFAVRDEYRRKVPPAQRQRENDFNCFFYVHLKTRECVSFRKRNIHIFDWLIIITIILHVCLQSIRSRSLTFSKNSNVINASVTQSYNIGVSHGPRGPPELLFSWALRVYI